MVGRMKHWQYDSFITEFDDKAIEPAYVSFTLDADGKVTGVKTESGQQNLLISVGIIMISI